MKMPSAVAGRIELLHHEPADDRQQAKCHRNPKQNPECKPDPRPGGVRVENLSAPLATKSFLATQLEHECRTDAADHLRRDRRILRSRNLVACARLAAGWAFDGHERLRVRCVSVQELPCFSLTIQLFELNGNLRLEDCRVQRNLARHVCSDNPASNGRGNQRADGPSPDDRASVFLSRHQSGRRFGNTSTGGTEVKRTVRV